MAGKDYYEILGVPRNASDKEIRQAYRRLARKHHPDVNPGDKAAEGRFKEINRAYEVLSDPEKRRNYDRYGEHWEQAEAFERARQAAGAGGSRTSQFDLGDLFGRSGGPFETIFDTFFGGGHRRAGPMRGQNLEHPLEVSLEEAYHGTTRLLELTAEEPCPTCGGSGRVAGALCHVCQGQGVGLRPKRLEVRIPPGIGEGSRVRIAGEGRPGLGGAQTGGRLAGPRGDLYLMISLRPHERFQRKGDDLYTEVAVPLEDAVLGGEVAVPTLASAKGGSAQTGGRLPASGGGKRPDGRPSGRVMLKVPPLTQNGKTFRLAGLGMPRREGTQAGGRPAKGKGDLYARVRVVLPEKLSEREKELFEALRAIRKRPKAEAKA
jgi:DnaJ-class molecular chaperone